MVTTTPAPLVTAYMSSPVVTVSASDAVATAEAALARHNLSAVLVIGRSGQPAGVLSRRDLLRVGRVLAHVEDGAQRAVLQLPSLSCGDLMSHPVLSVGPTATVEDACRVLVEGKVHRVFVVDRDEAVGVFSTKEAMRVVADARLATPLDDVRSKEIVAIDVREPWAEAAKLLDRGGIGGVVVTELETPVGLFTEIEALAAKDRPPSTPTEEVMSQAMLCLPGRTPLYRAAGFSIANRARRILVTHEHHARGVVSGVDFARAYLESRPGPSTGIAAG